VPFITFKPDGTIIRANNLFLRLFEYRLEEIKGKEIIIKRFVKTIIFVHQNTLHYEMV